MRGLHTSFRQLVRALVALIACDHPPPSAAATQEALSAIQENLRELDALCRAAGVPFTAAESLQELEVRRDALAAQATANNVRVTPASLMRACDAVDHSGQAQGPDRFSAPHV